MVLINRFVGLRQNSDQLLFYKDDGWSFFITFGVAADSSGTFYYPETVFYRFDEVYIRNQNIVTITNIDIKRIVQKLKKN